MRAAILKVLAPTLAACADPVTLTVGKYGTPVFTARAPRIVFAQHLADIKPDPMDPFSGAVLPPASFSRH